MSSLSLSSLFAPFRKPKSDRIMIVMGIFFFFTIFSCADLLAQNRCTSCDSSDVYRVYGYINSDPFCLLTCHNGSEQKAYLNTLHPGFFSHQKDGKLVVVSVIPQSPAYLAGVRRSDVILKINHGWNVGEAEHWSYDSRPFAKISVLQDGKVRTLTIGLKTIGEYLSENRSRISHFEDVSFSKLGEGAYKSPSAAFHSLGR